MTDFNNRLYEAGYLDGQCWGRTLPQDRKECAESEARSREYKIISQENGFVDGALDVWDGHDDDCACCTHYHSEGSD